MSTYYQVIAHYSLSAGKPSLLSVSLNRTSEYFPSLVTWHNSLSHLRFFTTLTQAYHHILFLFSQYPTSTAEWPVLDENPLPSF